ncbi:hypothetical protein [Sphingomonas sp. R1]|uniref:hypothetical protein n=1 Tax=Sphingomonas sp. R1 TaxID=399176 RepID=UPI0022252867|nr:hypothetical protein [Sphingomonas sp. R1]UYY76109.1 hypothetical protein OIM94_11260 [Sphingomonas sp. R1]
MSTITEAQEALAQIHASRAQLARIVPCPPSRHLAFAALEAGIVASPAAAPYQLLALAPLLLGLVLIVRWDRRRLGMFINGYRRGRTRRVIAAFLPIVAALYAASVYFVLARQMVWPSLVLGAIMFAVATWMSMVWQRVFVRELEAGL